MVDEKRNRVLPEVPVVAQEAIKAPEAQKEAPALAISEKPKTVKELPSQAPALPPAASLAQPTPPVDEITKEIEEILEEDLQKVYMELPEELRPKFKAQGELVARTIRQMIMQAKVKARKVLKLIVAWLKIIPGVNAFFLEQEAAIKTRKILAVAEEDKKT